MSIHHQNRSRTVRSWFCMVLVSEYIFAKTILLEYVLLRTDLSRLEEEDEEKEYEEK